MKKIVLILFCVLLAVTNLSGCINQTADDGKLNVVCTIFPQYDFVRQIAGDKVNLKMLVPLGVESHDFKLENMSVLDIKTVAEADIVIYVGGEGDADWINELKNNVKNDALWLPVLSATDLLPTLLSDSMEHHHEHGTECHEQEEHLEEYDEHVWTSPKRAADIVKVITEKLVLLDKDNKETYEANCTDYLQKLGELDSLLAGIPNGNRKRLIFADRFPFRYLCEDYGFSFDAAFSGCSAETDPSVAQINSLCVSATENKSTVIFYLENSNTLYAESIAKKVGAKALLLHSCHNVSNKEFNNSATYVSLMKNNIQNITEAFK